MIRRGLKPRFKLTIDLPGNHHGLRRVWPFRRSWIAIALLLIMDALFIIPATGVFVQAAAQWSDYDSLFDLVFALFTSAWLLGWVIAPLMVTLILAILLLGREVLKARPGIVEIFIGLPGVGLAVQHDISKMRNLRVEHPEKKSGTSWRGSHFAFDYGANTAQFGSAVFDEEIMELKSQIQVATGQAIRSGDALAQDIQTPWEAPEEATATAAANDSATNSESLKWTSPSSLALIMANLVPVAGAVIFGWSLGDVMVLYWAESAVIGFFNICKITFIGRWSALLAVPFFLGHFGAFMVVHFLFIYTIFVEGMRSYTVSGGDLGQVAQLFVDLWPALAALFISHAYSFFTNFLGRHEYRGRTVSNQMSEPYSRIIFMHLVLIFGGGLTMVSGGTTPVLLIVIGLKIYLDVKAHLKERVGSSIRFPTSVANQS